MSESTLIETIAHRGYSHKFPENTLEAFQGAYEAGARKIELDVCCTSEGIPIVIHNLTLEHTTDKKGFVFRISLEQLKEADAAFHFVGPDKKKFPKSVPIPTLEEVFLWANGLREKIELYVELKGLESVQREASTYRHKSDLKQLQEHVALKAYYAAKKHDRHHHDLFISFCHPSIEAIRKIDSKARIGFSAHTPEEMEGLLDKAVYHNAEGVMINHLHLNEDFIKEAHKSKLEVWGYTILNTEELNRCKTLGVNGVCLNDLNLNT